MKVIRFNNPLALLLLLPVIFVGFLFIGLFMGFSMLGTFMLPRRRPKAPAVKTGAADSIEADYKIIPS